MPMPCYTFLEGYDLSGKRIIPFVTHGGSGFSNTIARMAELQPKATVEPSGLSIHRNNAQNCKDDVIAWLKSLKL